MSRRITSHVATVTKHSKSLRTVIPQSVVKKLRIRTTDVLEWVDGKDGDIIIKNIGTPVFRK